MKQINKGETKGNGKSNWNVVVADGHLTADEEKSFKEFLAYHNADVRSPLDVLKERLMDWELRYRP